MFTVNKNPDADELRKFGWAMLIGFGVIAMVFWAAPWWKARDVAVLAWSGSGLQTTAIAFGGLGLLLCIFGHAVPVVAKPVYVIWMSVTVPVGIVMSTVLLTILFVVLLPIFSIVVRFGDPLRKKLSPDSDTYWEDYKPHEATLDRVGRPF